jgi:AcrR family transcriptional regulator
MPRPPSADTSESNPSGNSRLASNQMKRLRRIVDTTKQLALEGGLEGVRLRDVAEQSDVALGTLYRYFQSKEDLLVYALAEELAGFEKRMARHPISGGDALTRVNTFFELVTEEFTLRRTKFAQACLQALASGGAKNVELVASVHLRWIALILSVIKGQPVTVESEDSLEQGFASVLENVWLAGLVGWAGGIQSPEVVVAQVHRAAGLLLAHHEETEK